MQIIFLIFIIRVLQVTPTLFVIQAAPVNETDCEEYELTRDECLTKLVNSSMLIAFGDDSMCTMCLGLDSFYETNETGTFFAIKTNLESCPASQYLAIEGDNYTTMYSNETWTIVKYCPTGWQQFTRAAGEFCMKIFYNSTTSLLATATTTCNSFSSDVVGFETEEERLYATSQLLSLAENPENVTMWVSGQRSTACNTWALYGNENTCGWSQGFSFGDTSLSSYDGYNFQSGEPKWKYNSKNLHIYVCLQLVASSINETVNGTMYIASGETTPANGFGCGYLLYG